MGNLEITIEDKRGSEVQNKYDIDELLLMLTLRHTLTNRNSISPSLYSPVMCFVCAYFVVTTWNMLYLANTLCN